MGTGVWSTRGVECLPHLPEAPPSGELRDDSAGAKEDQECREDQADEFQRQPAHRLAIHHPVGCTPGQTSEQDHPKHRPAGHCATPIGRLGQ
jgi:hypothetical protein